jgi:hypothetical protein
MAGIEPASERIGPRTSTSVVDLACRWWLQDRQKRSPASRMSPRARFRTGSGFRCGTPALCHPSCHRQEFGTGGCGSSREPVLLSSAYAAKGRAAYEVLLALVFCADFTSSAPLGSPSGTSLLRRSLSSPDEMIIT